MSVMLSIDPGIRGAGAALWRDGKLICAAYVRNSVKEGHGPRECATMAEAVHTWVVGKLVSLGLPNQLAIEWPQTYGGRASRGDSNSLFPLAGVDGALAVFFFTAELTQYVPHDWKGGAEKPENTREPYIIETRVRARLNENELAAIEWPNNVKHTWDVTDAIGVGLKHLKRFERHRIYARD